MDEIGARPDLFLQPQRAEVEGRRERILHGPDEKRGCLLQLSPAEVGAAVAHRGGDLQELHRVDVIDAAGFGMIPRSHVVAAHQHEVPNTKGRRAEQIGLQSEAVTISHRQLHDRLQAFLHQEMGRRQ